MVVDQFVVDRFASGRYQFKDMWQIARPGKALIRDDARATLQANAAWLGRWTSTRITIEGHCDGRGTSEYNLALGERRANAVKEYLMSLGVAADRLIVVSKGEESPACFDEHESCWQQNRRGHPVITAK
jgi:peptidoglycan-associated lipoprotein